MRAHRLLSDVIGPSTSRRRAGGVLGVLLSATLSSVGLGCGEEIPRSLGWRVSFASPTTGERSQRVELSIVQGSCTSDDVLYREAVARGEDLPLPPALGPGQYALVGRALTDGCELVAYGCLQVVLPTQTGAAYEVVLEDVPTRALCDGVCAAACPEGGLPEVDGGDAPVYDAAPPAGDAGACAGGLIGPNGHCYHFVGAPKLDWAAAEAACVALGGHLVSLGGPDEELWVYQQTLEAADFDTPARYWVGFTDAELEGSWLWSDGSNRDEPVTVTYSSTAPSDQRYRVSQSVDVYTHWGPNPVRRGNSEPNNSGAPMPPEVIPGEDCAEAWGERMSAPDGGEPRPAWNDASCGSALSYVCEQ